jgi:orotidine-5'-phosphate decarboxylase
VAAQDRLCFALDVPNIIEARSFVRQLRGYVGTFKVGLELFISEGPEVVEMVKESGVKCFLDLKLHDIPETVSRSVHQGMNLGVDFMTIHASGGPAMIQAAVEASRSGPMILAVTTLTSLDDADCLKVYNHEREVVVQDLMYMAKGAHGFVCSPKEVGEGRLIHPGHFFLVPGIRPAGSQKGDQKATGTPRQAIRDGADLLVAGRPIRDAQDPQKAAEAILREIEEAG